MHVQVTNLIKPDKGNYDAALSREFTPDEEHFDAGGMMRQQGEEQMDSGLAQVQQRIP